MDGLNKDKFVFITEIEKEHEDTRKSLTYWADAARRLRKHKGAMVGLILIILITLFAVVGPLFTSVSYSDQRFEYKNLGPILALYKLDDDLLVTLSGDYNLFAVSADGMLQQLIPEKKVEEAPLERDPNKIKSPAEIKKEREEKAKQVKNVNMKTFDYNGKDITLDYSGKVSADTSDPDFSFTYEGNTVSKSDLSVLNKMYPFGTDYVGRDLLTRVMYGTRISLLVALVATLVNFLIGVTYGAFAGFEGGRIDNIMMRIVDIINSIPLMLIVILIMVMVGSGNMWTIILGIGLVYWVTMAQLVRGQILSLKQQEFVLAAKALGVRKGKIIFRHLIPNAMGPIIVSMTMMIPTAIFTESFLGFIGLGVSAPMASLGTLANNALSGLLAYPYQLFFPALTIAIMMLAFNFLGDGLRDALDPRLRKG